MYNLKKIVDTYNFSMLFIKIISHYKKKIDYSINVLRHRLNARLTTQSQLTTLLSSLIARRRVRPQPLWRFWFLCVSLLYCLFCSLKPCDHMLSNDWPLGSIVCDVFVFCHFHTWCPRSSVVLDCIDSWSLSSSFLFLNKRMDENK